MRVYDELLLMIFFFFLRNKDIYIQPATLDDHGTKVHMSTTESLNLSGLFWLEKKWSFDPSLQRVQIQILGNACSLYLL